MVTSRLTNLPLELVCLICAHLPPTSLVALALSAKPFHRLIESPSPFANLVWRASRECVGLPSLKGWDKKEQEFMRLLLGKTCQTCGKKDSVRLDLEFGIRTCMSCRAALMIPQSTIAEELPSLHPETEKCLCYTALSPTYESRNGRRQGIAWIRRRLYFRRKDVEEMSAKLWQLSNTNSESESEDDEVVSPLANFVETQAALVKQNEEQVKQINLALKTYMMSLGTPAALEQKVVEI